LIEKLSSDEFESEKYHDEYRERFLTMVEQKAKGKEITTQPERKSAAAKLSIYLRR